MAGKEHYTKNTVEVEARCKKCKTRTTHKVFSGILGPCIPCVEKLETEHEKEKLKPMLAVQKGLF
jgi:hypothetical protein